MIEPDNKWKILWDFFIIFLYLCLFFIAALQISFDLLFVEEVFPNNHVLQSFFHCLLNMFLFIDILLKCFTAYYHNGILVTKPEKIFKNYISSHILYDFIAIIPIFLESYRLLTYSYEDQMSRSFHFILQISQLLIYFKSREVAHALATLDDMLQLEERPQAFFNLVKLVVEILLFSHFIACAWHAVGFYSPYHDTILEVDSLYEKEWFSQYLTFLFWTICPEKLEPKNELEYGFGFFAVLASHSVFGFIIEGIHSILESLNEIGAEMRKDIRLINKFFDKKNIGYDLQTKIRKYLYFMHEHQTMNSQMESSVINKLSSSLKEEVIIKANGEILQSIPLFAKNFSKETIRELVLLMRKQRFYPEEVIFKVDFIKII